jgi:hypothetical protein
MVIYPRPDYEEKKATLQDEIELVQEELSKIENLDDEIRRVEDLRRTLLSMENPLSGYYALTEFPDVVALRNGLYYGSKETAARRRQEFYRKVGLRVEVEEELKISSGVDQISVSADESDSGVISAPAPAGVPGSLSHPRS